MTDHQLKFSMARCGTNHNEHDLKLYLQSTSLSVGDGFSCFSSPLESFLSLFPIRHIQTAKTINTLKVGKSNTKHLHAKWVNIPKGCEPSYIWLLRPFPSVSFLAFAWPSLKILDLASSLSSPAPFNRVLSNTFLGPTASKNQTTKALVPFQMVALLPLRTSSATSLAN